MICKRVTCGYLKPTLFWRFSTSEKLRHLLPQRTSCPATASSSTLAKTSHLRTRWCSFHVFGILYAQIDWCCETLHVVHLKNRYKHPNKARSNPVFISFIFTSPLPQRQSVSGACDKRGSTQVRHGWVEHLNCLWHEKKILHSKKTSNWYVQYSVWIFENLLGGAT